jgi:RimJ/RimL family protein N-acetyltransferase
MATDRFKPDRKWIHSLDEPECKNHLLLVPETSGKIIGWCRLFPNDCSNEKQVELGIGILKDFRRLGIGRQLLFCVIDWAWSNNINSIVLNVSENNLAAYKFYQQHHFEPIGCKNGSIEMTMQMSALFFGS